MAEATKAGNESAGGAGEHAIDATAIDVGHVVVTVVGDTDAAAASDQPDRTLAVLASRDLAGVGSAGDSGVLAIVENVDSALQPLMEDVAAAAMQKEFQATRRRAGRMRHHHHHHHHHRHRQRPPVHVQATEHGANAAMPSGTTGSRSASPRRSASASSASSASSSSSSLFSSSAHVMPIAELRALAASGRQRVQLMGYSSLAYFDVCASAAERLRDMVAAARAAANSVEAVQRTMFWLDVEAPLPDELDLLADLCGIHPVTVDDCLTGTAREKWELFSQGKAHYLFCTFNTIGARAGEDGCALHVIVQPGFVMTFHERASGACIEACGRVLDVHDGVIPSVDWVLYALADAIVSEGEDQVQAIVDESFVIDDLSMALSAGEEGDILQRMKVARARLGFAYRLLAPKKNVLMALTTQGVPLVSDTIKLYLREVCDSVLRQTLTLDAAREVLSEAHANYLGAVELELARSGRSMDTSMAKLSIIGTMFMPLSFITGLMGMNCIVPGQTGRKGESPWYFWAIVCASLIFIALMSPWLSKRTIVKR